MRIGFLGLGRMGSLMAHRLTDAGYDVAVWNRTPDAVRPLVAAGARQAGTPRDAAAGGDLVISMLADPKAVDAVFFGPDGAAEGLGHDTLVAEMSTVGPSEIHRMRDRLPVPVRLIDAPVLGSLPQASAGELKIFAGGTGADVAACAEPLGHLGDLRHVGGLGEGAALKLAANLSFITATVAVGEAVRLAESHGLRTDTVLDALAETPVGALVTRMRDNITAAEAPPTGFALGLAEKDLALAVAEGAGDDGVTAAARARLHTAASAGLADQDMSTVIGHLRGRSAQ
ncbi:NAD(P)-dependent oxidoreductase [Nocardiopsis sediminis]|uniref:NAD(P)-dependent oxidoreductase n=1 Tax=Nocardiopsis sediminis TaxID=1778267 RepID=A0ABV8FIH4_9ACTN